ncbi:DNA adenine methylase [Candidatus Termititenax aidoneus]|uniref:Site-specific DNA-methyltransferase (adenine-specific) n=1 Tax=Termititenax aidoneus TaxID=2218524 RepID=A0A388TDQ4_TERA1|nr:DNA adenine methylase [Candidatus Termititenax aidoneus]
MKNKLVDLAPVVKWAGGKRQLLADLLPLLPKITPAMTYCEPFVGGGALLFNKQPAKAIINDINAELIQVYQVICDNVDELISELQKLKNKNKAEDFYAIRKQDREPKYKKWSRVKKAARIIYLNKTCYNGLFRVNNAGEFNAPFGHYKNPNIVNKPVLYAVSKYFRQNDVKIFNENYLNIMNKLPKNSFVYLDPPYDPVSTTANFTGYTQGGFSKEDQKQLRKFCEQLDKRGIKFMLSNSDTKFIRAEYNNPRYNIKTIKARRIINSDATKRGEIDEVVIRNYYA